MDARRRAEGGLNPGYTYTATVRDHFLLVSMRRQIEEKQRGRAGLDLNPGYTYSAPAWLSRLTSSKQQEGELEEKNCCLLLSLAWSINVSTRLPLLYFQNKTMQKRKDNACV